jgi:mono/diheme cytochrome c family protein
MMRAVFRTSMALMLGASLTTVLTARQGGQVERRSVAAPLASHDPAQNPLTLSAATDVVRQYCTTCHSDRGKAGGLSLAAFDAAHAPEQAVVAEKMILKLRSGMMPPPGARRPDEATLRAVAAALETHIDQTAASRPNAGPRPFQRLNRAEYARSIRDLLGLEIDVEAFLPPDTSSAGFDNVADVQVSSATLMEGYLRAATRISWLAVGDRNASASETTHRIPRTASQMRRVEGAPIGTRGGISVVHIFPADGEYRFRMQLASSSNVLYGSPARGEQIEVSIDGERVALVDVNPRMTESDPTGMDIFTPQVHVAAGQRRVTAAFIQRFRAPVDDLIAPVEHTLADGQIGLAVGVTTLPHMLNFSIIGPHGVTGVADTVSRRNIFTCRPASANATSVCAEKIVRALADKAYRAPADADSLGRLMQIYYQARKEGGDFEIGIRTTLQAILVSPQFLFHFEFAPASGAVGKSAGKSGAVAPAASISEFELASRLSSFLWATLPDEPLKGAASKGQLRAQLAQQTSRMLQDPRAEALASRFAAQWLRLQELDKITPDPPLYPYFDHTLGEAMATETRLFFEHLVREDRSVLELLTADYSFVNERLAAHYGISDVSGTAFRKVTLPENRRGILGHGSILTLTSIADRTSPVLRGKWVMEVMLGTPPPPPPPNVPELEPARSGGRLLSVRERMQEHRASPACSSCHRVIDPLGLALEHFDVTGHYRIKDNGHPIDASGELYDGTKISGLAGLRDVLLQRKHMVLQSFTENLMTYALGRRVEAADMPTVRAIVRAAEKQDYRISAFINGVIASAAFQMRSLDTVTDRAQGSSTGFQRRVPRGSG